MTSCGCDGDAFPYLFQTRFLDRDSSVGRREGIGLLCWVLPTQFPQAAGGLLHVIYMNLTICM